MWHKKATNKFKSHKLSLADYDFGYSSMASFENVSTTDTYRKGNPYKLLGTPGGSSVQMKVGLGPSDIPENYAHRDLTGIEIVINHCRTTSNAIVDILLNNEYLIKEYKDAPPYNFGEQTFKYPIEKFKPGQNFLTIRLSECSPAVYWLSNVKILANLNVDAVH
ncbi:hypothetical protein FSP39_006834 [Pinctada imbricata]|uniref:Uncharacterized protein n=1 Tax=Pinctada imbricata TaxID=66713 RepID=A0AA88XVP4_PINIB|nr:hypothetical protein FSP39_006834 [Pinctada imbricata]